MDMVAQQKDIEIRILQGSVVGWKFLLFMQSSTTYSNSVGRYVGVHEPLTEAPLPACTFWVRAVVAAAKFKAPSQRNPDGDCC